MTNAENAVAAYYRWKNPEYLKKYSQVTGLTHIHVGLHPDLESLSPSEIEQFLARLSVEQLRTFLARGQNNTLLELYLAIMQHSPESLAGAVLDCGAGLGGTSCFLGRMTSRSVTALTISPEQAAHMSELVKELGLGGQVVPVVGDILNSTSWTPVDEYSLVIGIDAFSQMGEPSALYAELYRLQSAGGTLVFFDAFAKSQDSDIAMLYNTYWVSTISTYDQALEGLTAAGYVATTSLDLSRAQLPYWLASAKLTSAGDTSRSAERRRETLAFHNAMSAAYLSGDIEYRLTIAHRPTAGG